MRRFLSPTLLVLVSLAISPRSAHAQREETISDKAMTLVKFSTLEYPKRAAQALVQGIVVVRAKLDESGGVVSATAVFGEELLIPASLDNAKQWRFKPNTEKAVVIVYDFRVNEAVSKPGCSNFLIEPPNFATITMCAPGIQ
jgi:outer membrane biosynthesis protein TonB